MKEQVLKVNGGHVSVDDSGVIRAYGVELKPVQYDDIEQLRLWRNQPEIARQMLCEEVISALQQERWFSQISHDSKQRHYVIRYKKTAIGAVNIKSLSDASVESAKVLEPGMYIGNPAYRGNLMAFLPALAINDYCFDYLGVEYLQARVKASNLAAIKFNQKLGYQIENKLKQHFAAALPVTQSVITMRLDAKAYRCAREPFSRFAS